MALKLASLSLLATVACGPATAATVVCASPEQAVAIRAAYAQTPGAMPHVIAAQLKVPEVVVVTGLPQNQTIGVMGEAFPRVWKSLTAWERPGVVVQLEEDHLLEIVGRIGPEVNVKGDQVEIEILGSGIGGHFKISSISGISLVALPRANGLFLHGALFFGSEGKSLFGIYTLDSNKRRTFGSDPFQRTWDLVSGLPRLCENKTHETR